MREHLELDARRAGVDDEDRVHCTAQAAGSAAIRAARMGIEHRGRAGRHARPHGVGARGQDDRHPRAENEPGGIGLGEKDEVLGQHVAGFEIGHDEDLGAAGDLGLDALDPRRLGIDGIVEGERPVEDAAGDLAAVGHLAERRGIDGRGNLRRHRLDGGKNGNPRRAEADLGEEIDDVLDDVALGVEVGGDVDGRVGDEQRLGVGRHVHDEDMADPPRGAQAGLSDEVTARISSSVCRLPFIRSSPLDSRISSTPFAAAASLCGTSTISKRSISRPCSRATAAIFAAGPDQDRNDDAGFRRFDRAAQRRLVARMHHDRRCGRDLLGAGDEPLVLGVRRRRERTDRRNGSDFAVLVRRHDHFSASVARCTAGAVLRKPLPGAPLGPGERGSQRRRRRRRTGGRPAPAARCPRRTEAPLALSTCADQVEGLRAGVRIGRKHRRNGRERRLLVDQQHVELLAHQRLEGRRG